MNGDISKNVLVAAMKTVAVVNPDTIRRNASSGAKTSVNGEAFYNLAVALEQAYPGLLKQLRAQNHCDECGWDPWKAKHADACPHRTHVVYGSDGNPVRPPSWSESGEKEST
jgi:hypothetical protein